jgi:hypothetical protein
MFRSGSSLRSTTRRVSSTEGGVYGTRSPLQALQEFIPAKPLDLKRTPAFRSPWRGGFSCCGIVAGSTLLIEPMQTEEEEEEQQQQQEFASQSPTNAQIDRKGCTKTTAKRHKTHRSRQCR